MPLFAHDRFKPRKPIPRKFHPLPVASIQQEDHGSPRSGEGDVRDLSLDRVTLKIGSITSVFQDGEWHSDIPKGRHLIANEILGYRAKVEKLEDENNMLRVKNEVLLDTVTLQNIKIKELEREAGNLRRIFDRSCSRFVEDEGGKDHS